ncbi:MAG: ATP-binding protein [Eubacteriales bacterium]
MYASRGSDFGNGRTVTELIDRMKARAAERVRRTGEPPELTLADIPEKFRNLIGKRLRDIDGVHAMIDGIIGLGGVKRFLTRLADDVSISGTANCPRNFCFVGPPGTGKSMIADRLAKMLCMLGVIGEHEKHRRRQTTESRGRVSATETVSAADVA